MTGLLPRSRESVLLCSFGGPLVGMRAQLARKTGENVPGLAVRHGEWVGVLRVEWECRSTREQEDYDGQRTFGDRIG